MDDKYRIMTLDYLYSLLDLKEYEKMMEDNDLDSIIDGNGNFKYFTLLSDGDISLFTEEEQNEYIGFDKYTIEEMLTNEEIKQKMYDFIERTFNRFYFSNANGEYLYYDGYDENHMVPDDAFALGINYRVKIDENNFEEINRNANKLIVKIINDIQFNRAKEKNLKVAVIENNGLKLKESALIR